MPFHGNVVQTALHMLPILHLLQPDQAIRNCVLDRPV